MGSTFKRGRRADKSGRSSGGPPFVQLYRYLLDSAAWLSLSPYARTVFVVLLQCYNGRNNGRLCLSQRDAARLGGMAEGTARKALGELQDRGFIELATPGSFTTKVRHAAEWRVTAYPDDVTGELPSKAFMSWRPGHAKA